MNRPYWLTWDHIRFLIRWGIPGYVQRARRGWADHDTWGLDHYMAGVLAGALRHMANKPTGTPGWVFEANGLDFEDDLDGEKALKLWSEWLRDKAEWFEWYKQDDLGFTKEMDTVEKRRLMDEYDKKYTHFMEFVLPDFTDHFDSLWD